VRVRAGKIIGYFAVICLVFLITTVFLPLNASQKISLLIFTSFIAGSLFYWHFRNAFALVGIALLLGFKILDVEHLIEFANLDIVIFLIGMMIVVGFLEEKRFFDWLIIVTLKPFMRKPYLLLATLLILGTVMAALVDEVTSILFMSAIMLRVLKGYGFEGERVLPFIMFLVFTTNIGSSALPVGNPIGVLIAFKAGFTIEDFIYWVLPLAIISSLITTLIGVLYLKRTGFGEVACAIDFEGFKLNRELKISLGVFIAVIAGLILHFKIEELLGLEKNIMLLGVPLFMAGTVLLISRERARDLVEKVDWWTLLYFIMLFASVGTLKYTGVTDIIAHLISTLAGDLFSTMLLIGIVVSILTAFMDNVLAVATLVPVVQALGSNLNLDPVWWIMLIGGTYCGNATIIGSTANIVAAGLIEKKNCGHFSMLEWMKIGVPISILTFLLAFALLYIRIM
jgi:Na+/H+ antiporter NhaD/arsenite permease-like protein